MTAIRWIVAACIAVVIVPVMVTSLIIVAAVNAYEGSE